MHQKTQPHIAGMRSPGKQTHQTCRTPINFHSLSKKLRSLHKAGRHIQQKCAADIPGIEDLASIFSRSVPRTLQGSKAWPAYSSKVCHERFRNRAWPAYSAEVCHRRSKNGGPGQHIRQKCATDIAGIESLTIIFSRSMPQTLQESKAWPAYSADVCHRHPRNRRPGQHILQKCATDIPGIESLASIFSRSVPRTLHELKAWPAYSAEVCHRHCRN